jgi:hypothetical protein
MPPRCIRVIAIAGLHCRRGRNGPARNLFPLDGPRSSNRTSAPWHLADVFMQRRLANSGHSVGRVFENRFVRSCRQRGREASPRPHKSRRARVRPVWPSRTQIGNANYNVLGQVVHLVAHHDQSRDSPEFIRRRRPAALRQKRAFRLKWVKSPLSLLRGLRRRADTSQGRRRWPRKTSPGFTAAIGPKASESTTSPARSGRLRCTAGWLLGEQRCAAGRRWLGLFLSRDRGEVR